MPNGQVPGVGAKEIMKKRAKKKNVTSEVGGSAILEHSSRDNETGIFKRGKVMRTF